MTDTGKLPPSGDHSARVQEAFDSLHQKLGDRLDGEARESVEKLREAAATRDADRVREQMGEVRQRHGWLYRELAEHPEIATMLDELALWGF